MRSLAEVRADIDAVDAALETLLARRFALGDEVAEAKRATGRAVSDPAREEAILSRISASVPSVFADDVRATYAYIFERSRARQHAQLAC